MSDGRQPRTAAFLRAKRVADGLRPASAKARLTKDQLTQYRNAVADYEVAFDVAERDARRLKDSSFTTVERKRLDTAKQLLTIAIDEAATPAERQGRLSPRAREAERPDLALGRGDEVLECEVVAPAHHGRLGSAAARGAESGGDDAGCRCTARPRDAPAPPSGNSGRRFPRRISDTAPGRVVRPESHPKQQYGGAMVRAPSPFRESGSPVGSTHGKDPLTLRPSTRPVS